MANLDLTTVELVSTLRAAPQNGSPSSQDYNDSWTESLADLAAVSGFINDIIIPLLNGLDATVLPNPNGIPAGIEGRYIFGDTSDLTPLFFDILSTEPLTIADSMRILQGIIQTTQATVTNLMVEVTALQTQLSSTNQNDIAQALQNFAAALQSLTNQTVSNTQAITNAIIKLQNNGTDNIVQNKLNLVAGPRATIVDNGFGRITLDSGPVLKTGGTNNSTQNILNLAAGTGISLAEVSGAVTITNTHPAVAFSTDSIANGSQSILNLIAGSNVTLSETNGAVTINATGGGGGGTPAGSTTQVQFNDAGAFGGDSRFTFDKSTGNFTVASDGAIVISDSTGNTTGITINSSSGEVDVFASGDLSLISTNGTFTMIAQDNSGNAAQISVTSTQIAFNLLPGGINAIELVSTGGSAPQKIGFFNATPAIQPTVTGSRGGNVALASLLTALANLGLIVDSSTV